MASLVYCFRFFPTRGSSTIAFASMAYMMAHMDDLETHQMFLLQTMEQTNTTVLMGLITLASMMDYFILDLLDAFLVFTTRTCNSSLLPLTLRRYSGWMVTQLLEDLHSCR